MNNRSDLEKKNRQLLKKNDQEVRKNVVQDRRKELANILVDLEEMLAESIQRSKQTKREAETVIIEQDALTDKFAAIDSSIAQIKQNSPETCHDNVLADVANKIESTRRSILTIDIQNKSNKASYTQQQAPQSIAQLSSTELIRIGLSIALPLTLVLMTIGVALIITLISLFS